MGYRCLDQETVTFVIDLDGKLRLADRNSEHVACAGGGPVLAAGEMTFLADGPDLEVVDVNNNSDVLIHAGDLTLGGTEEELTAATDWLGRQPHRHKIASHPSPGVGTHRRC